MNKMNGYSEELTDFARTVFQGVLSAAHNYVETAREFNREYVKPVIAKKSVPDSFMSPLVFELGTDLQRFGFRDLPITEDNVTVKTSTVDGANFVTVEYEETPGDVLGVKSRLSASIPSDGYVTRAEIDTKERNVKVYIDTPNSSPGTKIPLDIKRDPTDD